LKGFELEKKIGMNPLGLISEGGNILLGFLPKGLQFILERILLFLNQI
jgi:hypothetical protein